MSDKIEICHQDCFINIEQSNRDISVEISGAEPALAYVITLAMDKNKHFANIIDAAHYAYHKSENVKNSN